MTNNRAAIVAKPGGKLEVTVADAPEPGPGEVLIRNYAVALQPLDAKMLIASYGPAAQLHYPAILGSSGAGIIEQLGEGVTVLRIGDRVVFDTKAYVEPLKNRRQGTWQQLVVSSAVTVAKVYYK